MRTRARIATLALLVLVCVASALALPQGAGSQADDVGPQEGDATPAPGTLLAEPAEGPTGTPIAVSGADCLLPGTTQPGDAVLVTLGPAEGVPLASVSLAVAADGTWTGTIAAPAGSGAADVQVAARCVAPEQDLVTYEPQAHTVTGEGDGSAPPPPASTLAAPDPALATTDPAPEAEGASAAGELEGANAGLPSVNAGAPIEPLPAYDPQTSCSPTARPGMVRFQEVVMAAFPNSGVGNIVRACSSGGTSEHKEGRAWDWGVNASNSAQAGYAQQVIDWLLATDSRGNRWANARRLGVMYIIWNRQMFRMYRPEDGWQPYTGASPHTDHVHFSLTRAGGEGTTSFWSAGTDSPAISYTSAQTAVGGTYESPVTGDFDGDGRDDVVWYAPGGARDYIWWGRGDRGFDGTQVTVNGTYQTLSGDFDGDGRDDVLWYAPGGANDYIWYGNANGTFTTVAYRVNGTYVPLAGDFDGDGDDDVVWYGRGSAPDVLWRGAASRRPTSHGLNVTGTDYLPLTGDFDGDGKDDVFWYGPAGYRDVVWYGTSSGFAGKALSITGTYPGSVAGDLNGDGRDDVVWYAPGPAKDNFYIGLYDRRFRVQPVAVNGTYVALPGDFDGDGSDDVLWYGPGAGADWLWWTG